MSLSAAITEIEGRLAALSLTKHPDAREGSMSGASVTDGHYIVSVAGGGKPWPEAAPQPDGPRHWVASVRVEISTLIKANAQESQVLAASRGRQAVTTLLYTPMTNGQLWPQGEPETTAQDRLITWVGRYNLRYQE